MRDATILMELWQKFTSHSELITSTKPADTFNRRLKLSNQVVFLDFETTGLDSTVEDIHCYSMLVWGLSDSGYTAYSNIGNQIPLLSNCIVIAANVGFERSFLNKGGKDNNLYVDIKSLCASVSAPTHKSSLTELSSVFLNTPVDKDVRQDIIDFNEGRSDSLDLYEASSYCYSDVSTMVDIWKTIQRDFCTRNPHAWSRFGILLASTIKTPVDGLREFEQDCARYFDTSEKVAIDGIRGLVIQLQNEAPSWFMDCPRKTADKAVWLQKCAAELENSEVLRGVLGSCGELSAKIVSSFRAKAKPWIVGGSSYGDSFTANLVRVGWLDLDGSIYRVSKDACGWHYIKDGLRIDVCDKKTRKPITGNTPLTNNAPMATEDKPGLTTDVAELQQHLSTTAFYRSIRSRLSKVVETIRDGFIYPTPTVGGTFTGRAVDAFWLVLANPKPGRLASEIKTKVTAKEGYKLLRYDFSSQELRIAHMISAAYGWRNWGWERKYENNPYAIAETSGVRADGTDSHSLFARRISELSNTEVTRDIAKNSAYACQFGSGAAGLSAQTGLSIEISEKTLEAYKGSRKYRDGRLEYRDGVLSGYFNYCADLTEYNVSSLIFGRKPHATGHPVSQLTLNNYPVQGTGVDMRDVFLTTLYLDLQTWVSSLTCMPLVWADVCAFLLHDEQGFHVPDQDVEKFAQSMAKAHTASWKALAEGCFGTPDACPSSHLYLDGIEVYSHWRKEVDMGCSTPTCELPNNWDGGFVWLAE